MSTIVSGRICQEVHPRTRAGPGSANGLLNRSRRSARNLRPASLATRRVFLTLVRSYRTSNSVVAGSPGSAGLGLSHQLNDNSPAPPFDHVPAGPDPTLPLLNKGLQALSDQFGVPVACAYR